MALPRLVHVEWVDSGLNIDHGWASKDKYLENTEKKRMLVDTVGILMHEDEEKVVVALSHDQNLDTWYSAQLILRESIISYVELVSEISFT
jgi:hypothetical protein